MMTTQVEVPAGGGDLTILQLPTPGLGDNSYVVRSGDEVAVIDPQRDLDRVEAALSTTGGRLSAVLETHVHNDYVSGGRALAQRHAAVYAVPAGAGYRTDHRPLADGDELAVGRRRLRALYTPGHTPHHTSYVLIEGEGAGETVLAVFSGGCVMVGACGRTDLVAPEITEELTRAQYQSAARIGKLGDPTVVAPTHGAGSFCAASAAAADTWTTVGRERTRNPAFLAAGEDEFVRGQLSGLLAYPAYYAHMAELNRDGREAWEPSAPTLLEPDHLERRVAQGAVLVDGRPRSAFAAGHLPGSVNIELDPAFSTYVGWLFPFGAGLVLVLAPDQDAGEALRQCARIGIESIEGVLAGGVEAWAASGRPRRSYPVTDVDGMAAAMRGGDVQVLDVRQPLEWSGGRVPGAIHIHVADLPGRVGDLGTGSETPIYVYCRTGHRSAMAASILAGAGLAPVLVDGGFPDWAERGYPVET